ncbi:MAG: 2-hydroxyacyl-CoA dehydratase [Bacillota bacterium]
MLQQKSNNNPIIGYMCSYFPYKYAQELGISTKYLGDLNTDSKDLNLELSGNICGYVRKCCELSDSTNLDGIVVTNCCNGMQRLYDLVSLKKSNIKCYMLDLPRDYSKYSLDFYSKSVTTLFKTIAKDFSLSMNDLNKARQCSYLYDNPCEIDNGNNEEEIIYILGNAISQKLKNLIVEYLAPYHVKINSCSDRGCGDELITKAGIYSFEEQTFEDCECCARMLGFSNWFYRLLQRNKSKLAGLIYITSQHCDSFLFNFTQIQSICKDSGVASLGLEVDYDLHGIGQITTRLEAFKESIEFRKKSKQTRVLKQNDMLKQESKVKQTENELMKAANSKLPKQNYRNDFEQRMHLTKAVLPRIPMVSIRKIIENQIDVFTNKVWEEPERIIWTNMNMTVELFYAANLIPLNMELVAGWLASLGLSRHYISLGEGTGLSSSICSYHKATLGLLESGGLPKPKGVSIMSHICDGGVGVAQYFKERYGSDISVLNIPFHKKDMNIDYLTKQYKELINWIEHYTGKELKKEKIIHSLELSNIARDYWMRANELRKGEPLFPGYLSMRNLFGSTFLFGSELGCEIAKAYYEQLLEQKKNIDANRNAHNETYKKRILWIHFAPLYGNGLMEYLEKELDCSIVMDITSYIYWDEYNIDKPLESLVNKALSHFYLDKASNRSELYKKLIEDYSIDGVIHFMHTGCRAIPGASWMVRDIAKRINLPYMELHGDCIDPRGFSEEQMKLRMEAFKESLGGSKNVLRY